MPLNHKIIPVGYSGIAKHIDPLLLNDSASPDLLNVEFFNYTIRRARNLNLLVSAKTGHWIHFDQYTKYDGSSFLVGFLTDSGVYKYANNDWVLIGQYSGSDRVITSTTMNDLFIFTDYYNNVKKWDGTTMSDLGGSPPKAKFVCTFFNHLILGFVQESGVQMPYRVQWSDTGNPEVWNSGNAGFYNIVDTTDWITGMCQMSDRLYIYKEHSIWELIYVGYPTMFSLSNIINDVGLVAPKSLVMVNNKHVFLGNDNVYMFDGRNLEPIGDPIVPLLYGYSAIADKQYISNSIATYVEELSEYWLAVPTGASTLPNKIFRYHVPTKSWWILGIDRQVTAFGRWYKSSSIMWSEVDTPWTDVEWTWMSEAVSEHQSITIVARTSRGSSSSTETCYIVLGSHTTAETCYWDTKNEAFGASTRVCQFCAEVYGTSYVVLLTSTDGGINWTTHTSINMPEQWDWIKWNLNITCDSIRARLMFFGAANMRKIKWSFYGRDRVV